MTAAAKRLDLAITRKAFACAAAIGLAACGGKSPLHRATSTPPAAAAAAQPSAAVPGASIAEAVRLLERGDAAGARRVLVELSRTRAASGPVVRRLMAQIDQPPSALLGSTFVRYEVRAGDSLAALAQQFAGDSMLFYALARHNAIEIPINLRAGSLIEVPAGRTVAPRASGSAAPRDEANPAPIRLASPAAAKLRSAGLREMNAGQIGRAIAFFRQALVLAPGDALIASDLARAERVLSTVKGTR